ncbi:hypothetical protein LTR56_027908 [Elasticomyces elasticus]|nr:hypothetical protein LTR56_027908 [Elasticomyces elasticus]KAK4892470.1 hypothetical protein LTR49_028594 [Elasticomyces elasticus]KAK5733950.1 hypothetical protein LTS12_026825 [Elasticomyces elasticus]
MEAQRKTFMLLPDFSYTPNRDIVLGTVLPWSRETKLPDPEYPLNEGTRITPPEHKITTQVEPGWTAKHVKGTLISPSLDAELPVFSPFSASAAYDKTGSQTFDITCNLKTERFAPSPHYLVDALKNPQVLAQCRKYWRPSVYLVTGLMIAENAMIRKVTDGTHAGRIHGGIDTSGFSVPLKVGAGFEASKSSSDEINTTPQNSFILAYELTRLRLKGDGSVKKQEKYVKHALFDDRRQESEEVTVESLKEDWETEEITSTTAYVV